MDLVGELDYLSDHPPTLDVFTERRWLKLTRDDGSLVCAVKSDLGAFESERVNQQRVVPVVALLDPRVFSLIRVDEQQL